MVQNHMLQLLCLVAMEPPASLEADSGARREASRCCARCASWTRTRSQRQTVRGQYTPASIDGRAGPGLPRGELGGKEPATPRPSSPSRPTSTTGAGRACRSTCAPASGCRAQLARSSSSSARCRTRSSRGAADWLRQPADHPAAARGGHLAVADEQDARSRRRRHEAAAAGPEPQPQRRFKSQRAPAHRLRAAAAGRHPRQPHPVRAPRRGGGRLDLGRIRSSTAGSAAAWRPTPYAAGSWGPAGSRSP